MEIATASQADPKAPRCMIPCFQALYRAEDITWGASSAGQNGGGSEHVEVGVHPDHQVSSLAVFLSMSGNLELGIGEENSTLGCEGLIVIF